MIGTIEGNITYFTPLEALFLPPVEYWPSDWQLRAMPEEGPGESEEEEKRRANAYRRLSRANALRIGIRDQEDYDRIDAEIAKRQQKIEEQKQVPIDEKILARRKYNREYARQHRKEYNAKRREKARLLREEEKRLHPTPPVVVDEATLKKRKAALEYYERNKEHIKRYAKRYYEMHKKEIRDRREAKRDERY